VMKPQVAFSVAFDKESFLVHGAVVTTAQQHRPPVNSDLIRERAARDWGVSVDGLTSAQRPTMRARASSHI
jgi:hypothetical protein